MSQDTLMLYKLMVLYMLDKVDFPLTRSQNSSWTKVTPIISVSTGSPRSF